PPMAVTVPPATDQIDYADLYARWERGNWSATEIDFSQDRIDWHERFSDEQRRGALWLYSLFFHGEDSVADDLSPYVDAAPREEQTYFLATQQVDEARHSVLFHRFMHEVVGVGDGSVGASLTATSTDLSWGYRKVFARLDQMADELRKDRSKVKLAQAVTLYHVIVEATMAQPGQHLIEESLERYDVLPGFREGMRHVSLDEQRHIGFGVKLLSDLYAEDPERIGPAILATVREVAGWVADAGTPPNLDRSYTECWGFTLEDIGEIGTRSLEQRLRAIGLPLEEMEGFPFDLSTSFRERAELGLKLRWANYLGPGGPLDTSDEMLAVYFDALACNTLPSEMKPGTTVQWDFTDADPWYLEFAGRETHALRGRASRPALTLRSTLADLVDVGAGRVEPARLLLTRRLRIRGNPLVLPRLARALG
ncbi:MAG TPA: ribonucleotide-diphosphate reductase subunit beta, partial [Solirubrobacteraceae bacterium]